MACSKLGLLNGNMWPNSTHRLFLFAHSSEFKETHRVICSCDSLWPTRQNNRDCQPFSLQPLYCGHSRFALHVLDITYLITCNTPCNSAVTHQRGNHSNSKREVPSCGYSNITLIASIENPCSKVMYYTIEVVGKMSEYP